MSSIIQAQEFSREFKPVSLHLSALKNATLHSLHFGALATDQKIHFLITIHHTLKIFTIHLASCETSQALGHYFVQKAKQIPILPIPNRSEFD